MGEPKKKPGRSRKNGTDWELRRYVMLLAAVIVLILIGAVAMFSGKITDILGKKDGVSESGGVVAEPVISRFHPIDHEDIDTHRQCKSFLFSQFLFHNIFNCFNICES